MNIVVLAGGTSTERDVSISSGKLICASLRRNGHNANMIDVFLGSDKYDNVQDFFNDKNDLIKYPRTLDADCRLLEDCGAAFAFAPSVEEMYPQPDTREFSYAPLLALPWAVVLMLLLRQQMLYLWHCMARMVRMVKFRQHLIYLE